jgi:nitroimidazol reductase NimA-like FMN-containing flavoprotein (pyridoxamine 5'-phosphate oxidase superfamily)
MVIRDLDRERCLQVLSAAPVARLACESAGQPYVVPVFLAYHKSAGDDDCLYGFTTLGQKVEWMRANPLVCVEVDHVTSRSEWVSVVAYGRFEELQNVHERKRGRGPAHRFTDSGHRSKSLSVEYVNEQLFAHRLLEDRAMWWEPASTVRTLAMDEDPTCRFAPIFYKIRLDKITGYEAVPDPAETVPVESRSTEPSRSGWVRKVFHRLLRGGNPRIALR